ncbi:MAG: hypothetical protein RIB84_05675 [Sneathiellaceae bacterium]
MRSVSGIAAAPLALIAGVLLALPAAQAQQPARGGALPAVSDLSDDAGQTYGSEGDDGAYTLLGRTDGSMLMGGSLGLGADDSPAWWMGFDRDGLPDRTRLLAPGTSGGIYGLVALANGDIAAVGDTESADGQIHAALHRIGPDGEVRWNAVVDTGAGTTYGISAVEMPGGDIVLGVEGLDAAEQPYAMAIRATADGQELWRQPVPDLEDLAGLVLQADGSLLAVGNKDAGAGNEIRLVALAADGSSRLHATMAGNGAMSAYRARPLPGGDILLAIDMTGADDSPGAMLRLGADGTVRWLRQIAAGAGLVENMQVLPGRDGSAASIAVAGALVAEDGEQDAFAGLLTAEGEWRWARRFRGPRDTLFYAIAAQADGRLLAAGTALEPLPPGAVAGDDVDASDQRDENAWLVTLSDAGMPVPATAPIGDPVLGRLAEEMRLAAGQLSAGSTAMPGFGPLGPPAFHQDGDSLVMATPPLVAGAMLLNVSRTRFRPSDRPDRLDAATVLALPVLQAPDIGGIATVGIARQRIDWRYALGSFLAERAEIALGGIQLLSPDGTRIEIASLEGRSDTRPQADGSLDIASRYVLQGLAGGRLAQAAGMPGEELEPFGLTGASLAIESTATGLDGAAYAAAMRASIAGELPQLQDFARAVTGRLTAGPLAVEGRDEGMDRRIALDGLSVDVSLTRPAPAAPHDIALRYGLQGLQVDADGAPVGRLGTLDLGLTGTGWDLKALEGQAADLDSLSDSEQVAAIGHVLAAVEGAGLEISGSDLAIDVGGDKGGFDTLRLALSAAGLRENAARIGFSLDGTGLDTGAQADLPLSPDLRPRDLALDLRFGPLPVREILLALLKGEEDSIPVLAAQSDPVLDIPKLAVVALGGAIRGDGRFAFDPTSPTMLAGQMSLLVSRLDNLRSLAMEMVEDKGERAMLAGFAAYLQELGQKTTDADGNPAERFEVQARPDGTVTVNGAPFPPQQ